MKTCYSSEVWRITKAYQFSNNKQHRKSQPSPFDLFAACVEYLMTLEYLVSQQCEKLNLMEVEGYEE
ncbi:hypothetical protein CFP56_010042, partial [Quercus suber]